MKPRRTALLLGMLLVLPALCALAGCATASQPGAASDGDAKTVRGLVDAMQSPAHSFPANLPR